MIILAALALGAISLTFVLYPLFRARSTAEPLTEEADEKLRELSSKRDWAYAAIKELEFEHEIGSLSDDDFQDLDQRYKTKAVTILKELDGAEGKKAPDDGLEAEIMQRRGVRLRAPLDEALEAEIQERRAAQRSGPFCTQCGARSQPGDRFCAACGANIS